MHSNVDEFGVCVCVCWELGAKAILEVKNVHILAESSSLSADGRLSYIVYET